MKLKADRIRKEQIALRRRSFLVTTEVEKWLKIDFKRSFYTQLRDIDKVRIFKLWVWAQRYKVDIRYILRVLVPYWSNRFKRKGGQGWGLGAKIYTFVGKFSQKILEEAIERDFPNRENYDLARHNRKMELLALDIHTPVKSRDVLDCQSIEEYVRKYKKRINVVRRQLDSADGMASRRLRPYRGNPWL